MSNINENMKLKDILFKVPAAADVFREVNIDFVNNGSDTLKDAYDAGHFNLENILYEVNELSKERIEGIDVSYMDEPSIIKYIGRKYNDDLLDELPVLNDYVEKLAKKYKKEDAEYDKVSDLFYNIYRIVQKYLFEYFFKLNVVKSLNEIFLYFIIEVYKGIGRQLFG